MFKDSKDYDANNQEGEYPQLNADVQKILFGEFFWHFGRLSFIH